MGIYQGTCVITEIKMPVEMATIVGVTRKILSTLLKMFFFSDINECGSHSRLKGSMQGEINGDLKL